MSRPAIGGVTVDMDRFTIVKVLTCKLDVIWVCFKHAIIEREDGLIELLKRFKYHDGLTDVTLEAYNWMTLRRDECAIHMTVYPMRLLDAVSTHMEM
jgi:hypothetical protein